MTVEECARVVTREVRQAVNRAYFRKTAEPEILPAVTLALQAFLYTETVRAAGCAEIVAQLSEVDGGPANESRWQGHEIARRFRGYAEDILATSPGKVGG